MGGLYFHCRVRMLARWVYHEYGSATRRLGAAIASRTFPEPLTCLERPVAEIWAGQSRVEQNISVHESGVIQGAGLDIFKDRG